MKRRCTAFILSDFIDQDNFKNALTIANRKHDVVALQVYDRRVSDLPPVGLMRIKDAVKQLKKDMITEIAATLAFSAIQNNDKIGVIFFSDRIEKFIPPKKGRKHILYIIRELIDFQPVGLMRIKDAETGHEQWIDTSSKAVRRAHRDWWINKQTELNDTFTKSNVDSVSVRTDQDYVKALLNLFAKRN